MAKTKKEETKTKLNEAKNKLNGYIEELKNAIEQRTGEKFQIWMMPQLRAAASNMVILDRIQDAIIEEEALTNSMTGSMGQQKIEVNPLVDKYNTLNRTLMDQFKDLGLNLNTAKGKVGGGGSADSQDDDPLAAMLMEAKKFSNPLNK